MLMAALQLASLDWDGCFVVALAPVAVMGALILFSIASSGRRKNLKVVAERLGGTLVSGFVSGDQVEFKVGRIPAILSCHPGSKYQSPSTRLQFDQSPRGRLRVFPEGVVASIRKVFGAQDIQIGDPRFDERFIIQGAPEDWVREILDGESRRRIFALLSLGESFLGGSAISLEAGSTGVTITCGRHLGDDLQSLQAFLDDALSLHARVMAIRSEGIQELPGELQGTRGNCPVCANPLDGDVRHCPACATSHHSDCWQYFGGCAIYGCGSRGRPRG